MVYNLNKRTESCLGLHTEMSAFATHKTTSGRSINVDLTNEVKRGSLVPCSVDSLARKRRQLPLRSSSSIYDEIPSVDFSPMDLSSVDLSSATIDEMPSSLSTLGIETIQTFEPVVNYPALVSFLVIAVTFGLLQLRMNRVQSASVRRNNALKTLRQAKAMQLSSSDAGMQENDVYNALSEYKNALTREENLRTIVPGVRIAAPNNPENSEDDIKYAKLYLGWDLSVEENDERSQSRQTSNQNTIQRNNMSIDDKDMPLGAKLTLGIVGASQLGLLCLFSFDPMTSGDIFGNVAGSPISILASSAL